MVIPPEFVGDVSPMVDIRFRMLGGYSLKMSGRPGYYTHIGRWRRRQRCKQRREPLLDTLQELGEYAAALHHSWRDGGVTASGQHCVCTRK
jgi:hypothetical protein